MAVGKKVQVERGSDSAEHCGRCWTLVCSITRFVGRRIRKILGLPKVSRKIIFGVAEI